MKKTMALFIGVLMVAGLFLAVVNFTAANLEAADIGGPPYNGHYYPLFSWICLPGGFECDAPIRALPPPGY